MYAASTIIALEIYYISNRLTGFTSGGEFGNESFLKAFRWTIKWSGV